MKLEKNLKPERRELENWRRFNLEENGSKEDMEPGLETRELANEMTRRKST